MLISIKLLVIWLLPLLALCAEDYYKLLGVDKKASDKDLKKAYRALSKRWHPDKNPDDESARQKFVDIGEAYDVLSNADTRKIYDQYGKEGIEKHKQGGGRGFRQNDPFDLFSRFFGGGGHFGGERKGNNMEVRLGVPLRDYYNGKDTEFTVKKQAICDVCEGSGSQDGKRTTCGHCRGSGMVVQKMMLAPGIYQQMQSQCPHCGGQGTTIAKPCKKCQGNRVVESEETLSLQVEPGMPYGQRVLFENEADEHPDYVAGDLLVMLGEVEPMVEENVEDRSDGNFFRRRGTELFWREVLSLREAWMGDWTRNITHLDGHVVQLSRRRGEVVQPGLVEVVKGEGMPLWYESREEREAKFDQPREYGGLHVEYTVVLPDQMESGMEKEFWSVWDKWRKKNGVDLSKGSGQPIPKAKDEL